MEKKDLKTGMRVEFRNELISVILLNNTVDDNGSIVSLDGTHGSLYNYKDNLLHKDVASLDIVKIYNCYYNWKMLNPELNDGIIWERKETEELTMEQVCKELGRTVKIIK